MPLPLSPGAQRVIDRLMGGSPDSLALIRSLWADGSRAHELLRGAGVTEVVASQPRFDSEIDEAWSLADLLRAAHELIQPQGRGSEIGTEHLLAVALDIPPIRETLTRMGVAVTVLRERIREPFQALALPLETDIRLRAVPTMRTESTSVARILDASANRCREGLRVVEDYARMILNDAHLSRLIKETRHGLVPWLSRIGVEEAIAARDTPHDVGIAIHTAFEMARPSLWSVVVANLKRVEEALRTLEEYGKTVDSTAAAAIGQLRYRFYTIEKGLYATRFAVERLAKCRLYLLVTDGQCPQGAGPVVKAALRGGVDVVQLREKGIPDRRSMDLAKWIRQWTAEAGALFIVNDRPDLACLVEADGVHVGQDDLSVADARRIVGGDKLVGVSTHSIDQARQGVLDGADYLGVGPTFASQTKSFETFAGLNYVQEVAREVALPAFAIGGINLENIEQVVAAGMSRVAVSGVICQSDEPEMIARRLRDQLEAPATSGT